MRAHEAFFQEIDRGWRGKQTGKIPLQVIGSAALLLQTNYERGTNDGDVLETVSLGVEIKQRLVDLAGKGTPLHGRRGMYLDLVANGLPFLPMGPRWHPLVALNASLSAFEIEVLDVVDVVVSKMKRFHSNDQSDVAAMIERGLVPHARLLNRFQSAVDRFSSDARAEELPRYVRNLHRVERDLFGVSESDIELPDWI